jgi:hypothetical protein
MKKPNWPKSISEIYKEAGCSDETTSNLKWLELQYPSLEVLLEKYRYLQPDGELFSDHSLRIVIVLLNIEKMLERQRDLTHDIEENLMKLIDLTFKPKDEPINFHFDENAF